MDTLAAYEGSTEAGRMEGEGIYKYEDGTKYVGQFKNGAFHGEGCVEIKSGATPTTHWSSTNHWFPHRRGQAHLRERRVPGHFNNGKQVAASSVQRRARLRRGRCASADRRLHSGDGVKLVTVIEVVGRNGTSVAAGQTLKSRGSSRTARRPRPRPAPAPRRPRRAGPTSDTGSSARSGSRSSTAACPSKKTNRHKHLGRRVIP